jgi:hypothetical protein
MESEFSFDRRSGLLKATVRGALDVPGLVRLGMLTAEMNGKVRPKSVVYDCTGVTSVNVPTAEVDGLAHLKPVLSPELPQVILAPQDYLFGLARMFQAMAVDTRPSVHVVRSWSEVEKLIGVTEPLEFEPVGT